MSASLETLAAHYWAASQALRGRGALSPATAAAYLASQASHPVHPSIERRCRRVLDETGIAGIEHLHPYDPEPAA